VYRPRLLHISKNICLKNSDKSLTTGLTRGVNGNEEPGNGRSLKQRQRLFSREKTRPFIPSFGDKQAPIQPDGENKYIYFVGGNCGKRSRTPPLDGLSLRAIDRYRYAIAVQQLLLTYTTTHYHIKAQSVKSRKR